MFLYTNESECEMESVKKIWKAIMFLYTNESECEMESVSSI